MYSFAQRKDCKVFDEPLYGFYLVNTDAKKTHPGAENIIHTMKTNGKEVINHMLEENSNPILFFKHMTHHLLDLNLDFLSQTINVIITRNPRQMIASFSKVIKNPRMEDLGYTEQCRLVNVLEDKNLPIYVVDSSSIINNPKSTLELLCKKTNIPFDKKMLTWKAGPIKEDGIWAKYWYKNVHTSTGFKSKQSKTISLSKQDEALAKKCIPYYDQLIKNSIYK